MTARYTTDMESVRQKQKWLFSESLPDGKRRTLGFEKDVFHPACDFGNQVQTLIVGQSI